MNGAGGLPQGWVGGSPGPWAFAGGGMSRARARARGSRVGETSCPPRPVWGGVCMFPHRMETPTGGYGDGGDPGPLPTCCCGVSAGSEVGDGAGGGKWIWKTGRG